MQTLKNLRWKELQHIRAFKPPTSTSAQPSPRPRGVVPNPFLPHKNPNTGRWQPPKYSLRRQADLAKHARATGTPLPPGPKSLPLPHSAGPVRGVLWGGTPPRAKAGRAGPYAGRKRMFKGHKWERARGAREGRRKVLMRDMAKRIRRFKSVYRRRRPNPLKPARSAKAQKLPF